MKPQWFTKLPSAARIPTTITVDQDALALAIKAGVSEGFAQVAYSINRLRPGPQVQRGKRDKT